MSGLEFGDVTGRVTRGGVDVDVRPRRVAGGVIRFRSRALSRRRPLTPGELHTGAVILRPTGAAGVGFEVAVEFAGSRVRIIGGCGLDF